MTSLRTTISQALKTRLETVKTANGYDVELSTVYHDDIPMGLELQDHQLPALFILDEGAAIEHEGQILVYARAFRLQLWHVATATDSQLDDLIRAIGKAIWANSPTAQVQDQYRIHEKVYQVDMLGDETDLHMIDANRVATLNIIVHYRTRPYDI